MHGVLGPRRGDRAHGGSGSGLSAACRSAPGGMAVCASHRHRADPRLAGARPGAGIRRRGGRGERRGVGLARRLRARLCVVGAPRRRVAFARRRSCGGAAVLCAVGVVQPGPARRVRARARLRRAGAGGVAAGCGRGRRARRRAPRRSGRWRRLGRRNRDVVRCGRRPSGLGVDGGCLGHVERRGAGRRFAVGAVRRRPARLAAHRERCRRRADACDPRVGARAALPPRVRGRARRQVAVRHRLRRRGRPARRLDGARARLRRRHRGDRRPSPPAGAPTIPWMASDEREDGSWAT